MNQFHTAIVGSGSGGLTVAVGLSKLGKRVVLIEKHHVGGDCTNVGCVPSKSLIHESFKVALGQLTADEALAQVRDRRDHLRDEETEWVEDMKNLTFIRGHARFLDRHRLSVTKTDGSQTVVLAKNVVLSTGASPRKIEIDGLEADTLLTNESMFELKRLPKHLAIIGAGVIALEMAFCFRRLGSRVSLLVRGDSLLKSAEPEVGTLLLDRLRKMGVEVLFQTEAERYDSSSQLLYLKPTASLDGVDRVLLAAGRVPNLDLSLQRAGVTSDSKGIATNSVGQTNVDNIFAIGDINHRSAFTHSANHQGRRLVKRLAFWFLPGPGPEPHYPSATFTEPEVAQVGPTLGALQKLYRAEVIKSVRVDLADTDRGYTMGTDHGFVMIHSLVLTGKILSATVVAPTAGEMISLLTLAVNQNISMYKLAELVFPYPVLSEAIKKATNSYVFETLAGLHKECYRYLRYRWSKPNT